MKQVEKQLEDSGREKLFDLAINRSLSFVKKMGKLRQIDASVVALKDDDLLSWHQQTRFAYRIPLPEIVQRLNSLPDVQEDYYWFGGENGAWFEGKTSQP